MKKLYFCFLFVILFYKSIYADSFKDEPVLPSQQDLDIIYFSPNGEISANSIINNQLEIIMIFNQPMISLSSLEDLKQQENYMPFEIVPPLNGDFHWYGTNTVGFKVKSGFLPGQTYQVIVKKNIKSIYNKTLKKQKIFKFNLEPIKLSYLYPNEDNRIHYNSYIYINLNYPIDINPKYVKIQVEKKSNYKYKVTNVDGGIKIQFKNLPVDSNVSISLLKELKLKGIPANIGENININYRTKGPIQVFFKDNSRYFEESYNMGFEFSNEVNLKDILDYILVLDAKTGKPVSFKNDVNKFNQITFISLLNWDVKPSSTYAIVIKKGLKDIYGSEIDKTYSYRYELKDRLSRIEVKTGRFYSEACGTNFFPLYYSNIEQIEFGITDIKLNAYLMFKFNELIIKYNTINLSKIKNEDNFYFIEFNKFLQKKENCYYGWIYSKIKPRYSESQKKLRKELYYNVNDVYDQILQFTDLGVTIKRSPKKIWLWVQRLSNGDVVSNANVILYDNSSKVLDKCITDQDGFCEISNYTEVNNLFYFVLKDHDKVILDDNARVNYEYINYYLKKPQLRGLIFFDRKLYKPGEVVNFKASVNYLQNGKIYAIPKNKGIFYVQITNSRGEVIYNKNLEVLEDGSIFDSFELEDDAPTGIYNISIKNQSFYKQNQYLIGEFSDSFHVADFRPVIFTVQIPEIRDQLLNEIQDININAKYLFGAPLINSKIEASIFINEDELPKLMKKEIAKLNQKGAYTLKLKDIKIPSKEFSYVIETKSNQETTKLNWKKLSLKEVKQISIEVKVYDLSDRYVTKNINFSVYPSWKQPNLILNQDYLYKNESLLIDINFLDIKTKNSIKESQEVDVYIFKEKWYDNFIKEDNDDELYQQTNYIPTLVYSNKVVLPLKEKISFKPKEGGSYLVYVVAKDGTYDYKSFYVSGESDTSWVERETVQLQLDKTQYEINDTATLFIKSPFQESKAIITIEQEDLFERQVINNIPSNYIYKLKIKPEYLPGVHISVLLLTHRKGFNKTKEEDVDIGKPRVKIGSVYLDLSKKSKSIPIKLNTSCDPCEPGQNITIDIETVPKGEIVLSVADRGILDLIDYHFPDALNEIYSRRPYNITVYDNRDNLLDQYLKKSMMGLINRKVGGGGDETLDGGLTIDAEDGIRKNFKNTAYWNPSIIADDKGRAKISFQLPDNITTFRIMAMVQKDAKFGQLEKEFKVAKKLVVIPVIPNFIRPNENIFIGGLIINNSNEKQKVNYELISKPEICKNQKQSIDIKPYETSPFYFDCFYSSKRIKDAKSKVFLEDVTIQINSQSEQNKDKIQQKIPVINEVYQESFASTNIIQKEQEEKILLPDPKTTDGYLELEIYSKLIDQYKYSLEYFEVNPYLCLEQRASAFYINSIIKSLNLSYANKGIYNYNNSKKLFLEELNEFQNEDGGFKLWKDSTRSSLYLTIYVLDILNRLNQNKTINIQNSSFSDIIKKAIYYIKVQFSRESIQYTKFYYFESLLYATYVLSFYDDSYAKGILDTIIKYIKSGKITISSQLKKQNSIVELSLRSKGYLIHLLNKYKLETQWQELLIKEFNQSLQFTNRKIFIKENLPYFSSREVFYTDILTISVWLDYFINNNYENQFLFKILSSLLSRNVHQSSSIDEATIAMLIYKFNQKFTSLDKSSAKIFINDDIYKTVQFDDKNIKYIFNLDFNTFKRKENKISFVNDNPLKLLFYTTSITYTLNLADLKPINQGFFIEKQIHYYDDEKSDFIPFKENEVKLKNGAVYLIKLKVINDKPIYNYVIRDPISSLTEVVNVDFKTESQRILDKISNNNEFFDYYFFDIYFNESYKDRYQILGELLYPGQHEFNYLIRTISKGEGVLLPTSAKALYEPEVQGRSNYIKIKVE